MTVRAILDVGQLLQQPERVAQMSPEDARQLVVQLASLLVLLSTRASEPPITGAVSNETSPAVWLSADQVESRFGLPNSWLLEHRRQLASLGIVSRPSRKIRVYDAKRLGRFLESRRMSASSEPKDFQIAKGRAGHQ